MFLSIEGEGKVNVHNYNDVGPWMSGAQQNVTAFGVQELVFAPGESEKFIGIEIIDDSLPEPSEQFEVVLSNPRNGATLGEFVRGRVCSFSVCRFLCQSSCVCLSHSLPLLCLCFFALI